jgi:hypothetical protein
MVHKNYKWNISEEEGKILIYNTMREILKERESKSIELNELNLLLNNRTTSIEIRNNNKKKNLTNFIKTNYNSIIYFIEKYDDISYFKKENNIYFKLNPTYENEWIFVENDE